MKIKVYFGLCFYIMWVGIVVLTLVVYGTAVGGMSVLKVRCVDCLTSVLIIDLIIIPKPT